MWNFLTHVFDNGGGCGLFLVCVFLFITLESIIEYICKAISRRDP